MQKQEDEEVAAVVEQLFADMAPREREPTLSPAKPLARASGPEVLQRDKNVWDVFKQKRKGNVNNGKRRERVKPPVLLLASEDDHTLNALSLDNDSYDSDGGFEDVEGLPLSLDVSPLSPSPRARPTTAPTHRTPHRGNERHQMRQRPGTATRVAETDAVDTVIAIASTPKTPVSGNFPENSELHFGDEQRHGEGFLNPSHGPFGRRNSNTSNCSIPHSMATVNLRPVSTPGQYPMAMALVNPQALSSALVVKLTLAQKIERDENLVAAAHAQRGAEARDAFLAEFNKNSKRKKGKSRKKKK